MIDMKAKTINISKIAEERTLRTDFGFHNHFSDFDKTKAYYDFDDLFEIVDTKYDYANLQGDFLYCQIGDVTKFGDALPVCLNFDNRNLIDENYYKKIEKGDIIKVNEDDILISFLLPQDISVIGKILRITPNMSNVFFTDAFIHIVPKKMPDVLYYCLKSIFYKDIVFVSRIRKGYTGYTTLDDIDLRQIKFDKKLIDKLDDKYAFLSERIKAIEYEILGLYSKILPESKIIDEVFGREFKFNNDELSQLKKIKKYRSGLDVFSNNPDLRFSAKFHRESGSFVMKHLAEMTSKKIKHFLAEPIVLGASVSPDDYSEEGTFKYISMATIKNWRFDEKDAHTVSNDYAKTKEAKIVKKDDIIMARSGEGTIGKVALISNDSNGIFSDFTMRIRLRNYNSEFAYYYFRTSYFQYLIEIYKKGLGNNTNIFPIVVQEFPMLNISPEEQQRIVDNIHSEIAKQAEIKTKISKCRAKIDELIKSTLINDN